MSLYFKFSEESQVILRINGKLTEAKKGKKGREKRQTFSCHILIFFLETVITRRNDNGNVRKRHILKSYALCQHRGWGNHPELQRLLPDRQEWPVSPHR